MADLRTMFKESSGRWDLTDAQIDVWLDEGRSHIRNNTLVGMSPWDEVGRPFPLICAAMYCYEYSIRNRDGADEWLRKLSADITEENYIFIEGNENIVRLEG